MSQAQIILHYLSKNSSATLLHILSNNLANVAEFWLDYSESMFLFSNSLIINFCAELKKYLYGQSKTTDIDDIICTDEVIKEIINRVKSKIRKKDIYLHKRFYDESINLMDVFKERMERLKYEIDKFDTNKGNNYRPVGFKPLK